MPQQFGNVSDLISYLKELQSIVGDDFPVSTEIQQHVMPWFIANDLILVIDSGPSSS
ncbi:hypothetical protein [Nannocystis pusilla]|uniref:hypothetical protein n=1 Tax=Nannocystis pusilla TaxID=889268 RepID=UPI003B82B50A